MGDSVRATGAGPAVDRARERFLGGGALPATGVRAEIAASWERSRSAGIDATHLRVPYVDDVDLDGGLVRCARPVLDDLSEKLSGCAVAVVLTDAEGHILDRRVGETGLARRLDAISLASGFSYAEQFAGTNGVGTTLSDGRPSLVVGSEHFTDRLRPFACAGAPIRHADGALAGVLDVTCPHDQASDLMRVLARQAAHDISQALGAHVGGGLRGLLGAFHAACAGHDGPVLAVGPALGRGPGADDFVVANGAARRTLSPADHDRVTLRASERLANGTVGPGGPVGEDRLLLADGPARLVYTAGPAPRSVGVVVTVVRSVSSLRLAAGATRPAPGGEAGRSPSASRPLSGLVGDSAAWRAVGAALRSAAATRRPVVVRGEPGVGKTAAVRAVHDETSGGARWVVVDEVAPAARLASLVGSLGAEPTTVVVRLGAGQASDRARGEGHADLVASAPPAWWVVGVATGAGELLPTSAATTVVVDPLRRRPDDVAALVDVWMARLAPGRSLRCGPEAGALLAGARWPGNVPELVEVLRGAAASATARGAAVVDPVDLPSGLARHGTRRRLSPLEAAERDLIAAALLDAGGNRVAAAAALGMGRTTLYRRLRAFGLADVGR